MIDETVILLSPRKDFRNHPLAKHIHDYLMVQTNFEGYNYDSLTDIFSNVIYIDYIERMIEVGLTGMNNEILEIARKEKPRYVLWQRSYYEIFPKTFDALREMGVITIGWFGDDDKNFEDYSAWIAPHLDYCLTTYE